MKVSFFAWLCFFPIFGMIAYVIIFTISALGYPGGSFNYPNAIGYSFSNNFLCDAMRPITQAGVSNPARSIAVLSHFVLSASMVVFFYLLPEVFDKKNRLTQMVRYFGVATMLVFLFMFTTYHDMIVTLTGIFGTVALIPFFLELRKLKNFGFQLLAYTCFGLSIIVFISFETKIGYYYLPLLQKITFGFDAFWVIWTCLIVHRKMGFSQKELHGGTYLEQV